MVANRLGLDAEKEAASFDFYSPAFREAYLRRCPPSFGRSRSGLLVDDWRKGSHGKMDPFVVKYTIIILRQLPKRPSWSHLYHDMGSWYHWYRLVFRDTARHGNP